MPTYLSPGVYVEEVDSGSRPDRRGRDRRRRLRRAGRGRAVQRAHPGAELDRVHPELRRVRRGLVPRAIRLRATSRTAAATATSSGSARTAAGNGGSGAGPGRSPPARRRMLGTYRVVALDAGAAEGAITVDDPRPSRATRRRGHVQAASSAQGDQVLEEYDRLNTGRGKANVATAVNAASKVIRIEETATGAAVERPASAPASACTRRRRRPPCRRRGCPPTTTSATSPSAPASPAWRPSTRSPWSASPT